MAFTQSLMIGLAVLASIIAILFPSLSLRAEVLGITRKTFENIHGEDFRIIPDTQNCEDLHLHTPSGLIFGASQANDRVRSNWFPPYVIVSLATCVLIIVALGPSCLP